MADFWWQQLGGGSVVYTNTCPHGGYMPMCPSCTASTTTFTWPAGPVSSGWKCPGCGACYSPSVAACWNCPQQPVTATGTNAELPAPPVSSCCDSDGDCVPEDEGGTCKGGRHCSC